MKKSSIRERWDNYRKANTDKPLVRNNELSEIFSLLNPIAGETILEVGTGNGYLSFPIAKAVGKGRVVTADVSKDNLQSVNKRNYKKLPIKTVLFNDNKLFSSINSDYFNAIATIATLHHFDNRKIKTGETGRTGALTEFYRLLKRGGRLVIADVAYDTISQRYFDAIDNPLHCFPDGHPHDFFTPSRLKRLLKMIGFKKVKITVKRVPWRFTSVNEAKDFIHTIHNAKCSTEESFNVAKKKLGFKKVKDHYELGWKLFFAVAYK